MFKKIPIVLSCDKNYAIPALVTIKSICNHISNKDDIEIFIFHNKLDRYVISLFEKVVHSYGVMINFLDLSPHSNSFSYRPGVPLEIFYPLFALKYLYQYEYIILLDTDLLIRDDILKLTHKFPQDKKLGAVRCMFRNYIHCEDFCNFHKIAREIVGIKNTRDYFNGGVIVLNTKAILPEEREKCLALISKQWPSNEEAILNHMFQDSQILFPLAWNFQMEFLNEDPCRLSETLRSEFLQSREDIKICHFIGPSKPWNTHYDHGSYEKYKNEWLSMSKDVLRDIDAVSSQIIVGPMWNKLKNL